MRFLKESIIIIFILVFVFGMEYIIAKITKKSINEINYEIENVEKSLTKTNDKEKMKVLAEKWKEKENILSFFIEHNELEKVSENIVNMKSNIDNKEYDNAKERIEEIKFRIQHIQNKQKFNLKNIF